MSHQKEIDFVGVVCLACSVSAGSVGTQGRAMWTHRAAQGRAM